MRILDRNAGRSIYIALQDGARVIPFDQIIYVDVRGHTLTYHLSDAGSLNVRGVLARLERELTGGPFVRVSNSCLVNANYVSAINGFVVRLRSGDQVTISRAKRKSALEAFARFFGGNR